MASQETIGLAEKGILVESLWHAVDDAAGNLDAVPGLVRRVIETEAWRSRIHKGKLYEHERFIDFITVKPLAGCGWSPDKVKALITEPDLLAMWREAVTASHGGNRSIKSDNITLEDGRGTSRSYIVARLKRDRPDLFDRVVAGELSANKAALEAGIRKRRRCPHCGGEI